MYSALALVLLGLVALANAHFQLQFPPPRGTFDEDNEPTFCDGYKTAANRSTFPLSGGFFSLNSEHAQWTGGVLVSTATNPTSFSNFSQIVPFFREEGEGAFCFPLDFTTSPNATGLQSGQNVTIQIVFNGGDGQLYQCADLTLSSSFQITSDVKCSNATGASTTPTATRSPSSASSTAPASSTKTAGATGKNFSAGVLILTMLSVGVIILC